MPKRLETTTPVGLANLWRLNLTVSMRCPCRCVHAGPGFQNNLSPAAFHMICSGKVETYLLEKSRIVQHQQNERSYHSFYQLCAGASDSLRAALHLGTAADYHYTSQGNTTTVDGVDDAKEFLELAAALDHCGFTSDEAHVVYQLLAGILHLGARFMCTAVCTIHCSHGARILRRRQCEFF